MSNFLSRFKAAFASETIAPRRLHILFRPSRWNYIKKINPEPECVFCKATRVPSSLESLVVFKSNLSCIVLNKFPYNSGHLLVIPQRHEGNFLNLTAAEYEDLHHTLKLAVEALKVIYKPHGLNIGLNLDKAAGAGLPDHLHYHVIPRFEGDLNFFPLIAETKVIPESLEECYKKIKDYFSKK